MKWNELGVSGGRALAAALERNKVMTALPLSGNGVDEASLKTIGTWLCVCMCACASVYDCVGRGLDLFGSPPPWLTPGAGLLVALLVQLWHRVLRSRVCCCCRRCTHEI